MAILERKGFAWTRALTQGAVSGVLIAVLATTTSYESAVQALTQVSPWAYPAVIVTLMFGLVLCAWNWLAAMRLHLLQLPFYSVFRAVSAGYAFNSILPGAGHHLVVRLHNVLPGEVLQTRAYAAIVLERIVRWVALLALGGMGSLALVREYTAARMYSAAFCIAAAASVILLVAFAQGLLDREFGRLQKLKIAPAILENVSLIGKTGRSWTLVILGPIAFQLLTVGTMYVLFVSMEPGITFAQCAVITAMAGVAGALPLTFKGIGAMEVAIVGVGASLGIDPNQALIVAVLHRLLSLLVGAAGGGLYSAEAPAADVPARALAPAVAEPAHEPPVPLTVAPPALVQQHRSWLSTEILEFTHDAIIIWEMDGAGILYWNQAAEQLYGYKRDEVLGKTTHTLLQTEIAGGTKELEARIARYGVWVGELRHVTRNGAQVQVQGRLALMSQRGGKWLVLEVNRDITDLNNAEIAQRSAEAQLAELRSRTGGAR